MPLWQNQNKKTAEGQSLKKIGFILSAIIWSLNIPSVSARIPPADRPPVSFSQEERAWLKNHKRLKMAVEENAPPYEYMKEGIFSGITSSYIRLIEQTAGVEFEPVIIGSLQEGIRLLEQGEVSLVPMANRAFSQSDEVLFSMPYVSSSLGIFGNATTAFINNFDDVLEQKIAVDVKTQGNMLLMNNRERHFYVYENIADALKAVTDNDVSFYVGDILYTKYAMDIYHFDRMRYIAPVVGSAYSFQMAVWEDDKMLLQIINKVLSEISPLQHFEIRQKWTSGYFGQEISEIRRYMRYLYFSFALFAAVLLFLFYRSHLNKKKALQIAHMQKMESIGRLAGGVAHDFNNMLAGIHGAAEMLDIKIGEQPLLKKYTDIILNACKRSSYLTSQLLVFSREREQNFEEVDMHGCLRDAIALLEHGLSKKIEVKADLKAKSHYISGNCNLIQSLILNLGFNAQDAMGGKGRIEISTRNADLEKGDMADCVINIRPGRYLEVRVKDYGSGIPKQIQPKIFEPFFTTKEVGKGTGLGLSAVYGIVLEHKGTIRFDSDSGGTCFYIYFPLAEHRKKPKPEVHQIQPVQAKIMVVDDEKILLELMKDILITLHAEVITVNNPLQAAEVYRQNPGIDIVMLDVIMPGKNGMEVYEELVRINPDLKVIFMSGYNKDSEISALAENNENAAFISKPYAVDECQRKIMDMLAKK